MESVGPAGRRVLRNGHFQLIGAASAVVALGFVVLTWIVLAAPGHSNDHPGGFTGAGRALSVFGCLLVVGATVAYSVGSLRVALILDANQLVIRNPWRTTVVRWESRPKFEVRNRRQDVNVQGPITTSLARPKGRFTYRYREIVCIVDRQQIWIAATSRMRHQDRVDELLAELRDASGQFQRMPVEQTDSPA